MYRRILSFALLGSVAGAAFVTLPSHETALGRPYQYLYEPSGRVVGLYQGVNPTWKVLAVMVKANPVYSGKLNADCVLYSYRRIADQDLLQTDHYQSKDIAPDSPLFAPTYNALSGDVPLQRAQALLSICREAKGKLQTKQQPLAGVVSLNGIPVDIKIVAGKAKAYPRK